MLTSRHLELLTGVWDASLAEIKNWRCQVNVKAGDREKLFDCVPLYYYESLTSTPLASRGWAVQERFLPRRTLHFTKQEVFWECHEMIVSETFPSEIPLSIKLHILLQKRLICSEIWTRIVREYSRCKLTLSRDRLVAISGLARLSAGESGDEYVAGMWRKDLELQLCWCCWGEMTETPGNPFAAPSVSLMVCLNFLLFSR